MPKLNVGIREEGTSQEFSVDTHMVSMFNGVNVGHRSHGEGQVVRGWQTLLSPTEQVVWQLSPQTARLVAVMVDGIPSSHLTFDG